MIRIVCGRRVGRRGGRPGSGSHVTWAWTVCVLTVLQMCAWSADRWPAVRRLALLGRSDWLGGRGWLFSPGHDVCCGSKACSYPAASFERLQSGLSDLGAARCVVVLVSSVAVVVVVLRRWSAATARGWCVSGRGGSWDRATRRRSALEGVMVGGWQSVVLGGCHVSRRNPCSYLHWSR